MLRREKTAQLVAFEAKMQTEQAQQIYKQRAGVAEFPNAWIKEKMGFGVSVARSSQGHSRGPVGLPDVQHLPVDSSLLETPKVDSCLAKNQKNNP